MLGYMVFKETGFKIFVLANSSQVYWTDLATKNPTVLRAAKTRYLRIPGFPIVVTCKTQLVTGFPSSLYNCNKAWYKLKEPVSLSHVDR